MKANDYEQIITIYETDWIIEGAHLVKTQDWIHGRIEIE